MTERRRLQLPCDALGDRPPPPSPRTPSRPHIGSHCRPRRAPCGAPGRAARSAPPRRLRSTRRDPTRPVRHRPASTVADDGSGPSPSVSSQPRPATTTRPRRAAHATTRGRDRSTCERATPRNPGPPCTQVPRTRPGRHRRAPAPGPSAPPARGMPATVTSSSHLNRLRTSPHEQPVRGSTRLHGASCAGAATLRRTAARDRVVHARRSNGSTAAPPPAVRTDELVGPAPQRTSSDRTVGGRSAGRCQPRRLCEQHGVVLDVVQRDGDRAAVAEADVDRWMASRASSTSAPTRSVRHAVSGRRPPTARRRRRPTRTAGARTIRHVVRMDERVQTRARRARRPGCPAPSRSSVVERVGRQADALRGAGVPPHVRQDGDVATGSHQLGDGQLAQRRVELTGVAASAVGGRARHDRSVPQDGSDASGRSACGRVVTVAHTPLTPDVAVSSGQAQQPVIASSRSVATTSAHRRTPGGGDRRASVSADRLPARPGPTGRDGHVARRSASWASPRASAPRPSRPSTDQQVVTDGAG